MKPGGGKAKGSGFERQVCKELSLWLSKGARDDLFWRSAMSGGRASVQFKRGRKNLTQTGDLTAIDPLGSVLTDQVYVECKFYRDLNLLGLFTGAKSGISSHWLECIEASQKYKKIPLLIAKQNHTPAIVCLDQKGVALFGLQRHVVATFQQHGLAMFGRQHAPQLVWYSIFLTHASHPE